MSETLDPIMGKPSTTAGEQADADRFVNPADQIRKDLGEPVAQKSRSTLPPELQNLTREQIQEFKRVLEATPDHPFKKKKQNSQVQLREIDGKIVVWFGTTYNKRVRNENGLEVEKLHIDVKFHGSDEKVTVVYKEDFIQSKKVSCEVIKVHTETEDVSMGQEVVSMETGKLVEMTRTFLHRTFTVVLPGGETAVIDGKYVNG